ncbi:MAG: tyrosine--tRNA ligase [Flavobacteriales bacterium]
MAVRNFIEELRWRGLLHDSMPGVEEHLQKGPASGYIGFDPTADSLHVGNLVQIMMLVHFQRCGHKPVALVGGATGMVGDPSGKKSERNLLDEDALRHNQACVHRQLERFLDFSATANGARLVNNYDWFKDMGFLRFIREVGKHITVNYMMAKDSVKNRLESGLSFTEFSYQLVQGYDYWWLNKHMGCTLQMGGSDQWGNITTGTELIRRMGGGEAYAITTPLLTKADGSKFGKSESGNVWLDGERTSPYAFYQFWVKATDADAARFAHIFTTWERAEVEALVEQHAKAAHERRLQKEVAAFITTMVHGADAARNAETESTRIFESLKAGDFCSWSEETWENASSTLPGSRFPDPFGPARLVIDLVSVDAHVYPSRGEAKRAVQAGALRLNGEKVLDGAIVKEQDLMHGRYLLIQKGKTNPFVLSFNDPKALKASS